MYQKTTKEAARELRSKGYSYREISEILTIAKNTAFAWTKDIILDSQAIIRLETRAEQARQRSGYTKTLIKQLRADKIQQEEKTLLNQNRLNLFQHRLACALIYWCEGAKNDSIVKLTNSDPRLIHSFLVHFRKSFSIDETKLRALVHLHEYHDEQKQLEFWSNLTSIPLSQFHKSYLKPHTGKRKRTNYPGCICVSYYSSIAARQLMALANAYMDLS